MTRLNGPDRQASNTGARSTLVLKPTEERCLRLLALHQYLTADQLLRALGLSEGCGSYARELVASLARFGLVERIERDRPTPHGSMAGVYTPSSAGRRWLARLGMVATGRYRPVDDRRRSRIFLTHALACADVAISASRLCDQTADLALRHLWHERALRRQPTYIHIDGKRRAVIPDLMLDLDANGEQAMVSCEVDLGSERGPAWKAKIGRLAIWAQGPYRSAFQTESLTIAIIVPGDERRARSLCRQTAAALDGLGLRQLGSLFVFTGQDPAAIPPARFWLAPLCVQPFVDQPVALIEGWSA